MSTVTKIEVTYGRTIQPKEYESKRAEATIGVSQEDLENSEELALELDEAMEQAVDVVHRYLGIGAAGKPAKTNTSPPKSDKRNISENPEDRKDPAAVEEEELTPGQKAARTRAANKAKKEAEKAAEAAGGDDFDIGGEETPVETSSDDFDIGADVDVTDPAEEVTDGDLQTAVNLRMKKFTEAEDPEGVKKVKAAIRAFAPDEGPFNLKQLPQEQRQRFLNKLEALK